MIREYQYLYVATSVYCGMLEAKLQGKIVPEEQWDKAIKLFQSAVEHAFKRFKMIPDPHFTLDDIFELISSYFGEDVDMSWTLTQLAAKDQTHQDIKDLNNV